MYLTVDTLPDFVSHGSTALKFELTTILYIFLLPTYRFEIRVDNKDEADRVLRFMSIAICNLSSGLRLFHTHNVPY